MFTSHQRSTNRSSWYPTASLQCAPVDEIMRYINTQFIYIVIILCYTFLIYVNKCAVTL